MQLNAMWLETPRLRLTLNILAPVLCAVLCVQEAIPADHRTIGIVAISPTDLNGKAPSVLDSSSKTATLIAGSGSHYVEVARYTSADGHFESAIKRYERVTLHLQLWPIDEVMHLLKGTVVLTDASGHSQTFTAGDSFVIPKNFDGEWKQLDTVEMLTVSYRSN